MRRVLNLYAGIGGNRRSWQNVHVTAVELDSAIAAIYHDLYPDDEIIVEDAHALLLDHYNDFDFIWSSPPCPTHSRTMWMPHITKRYPDMKLYEEIILLRELCRKKWVVENVKSYYDPLIKPIEIGRHYFWCNFSLAISKVDNEKVRNDAGCTFNQKAAAAMIEIKDFHGYKGDKRTLINNMIEADLGAQILASAFPICTDLANSFQPSNPITISDAEKEGN